MRSRSNPACEKDYRDDYRKQSGTVLFIDARAIFTLVDRTHREWTPKQIAVLANIVRVYRGEKPEKVHRRGSPLKEKFPGGKYQDILGHCSSATLEEIEAQGWSLNPGRFVGVGVKVEEEGDFAEEFSPLHDELVGLNKEAGRLEKTISKNAAQLLSGMSK